MGTRKQDKETHRVSIKKYSGSLHKEVKCKFCNSVFRKYRTTDKFCSPKCKEKYEKERKKEKRVKEKEKFGTNAKISTLKKQADAVFSDWIRERDEYKCCTCGLDGDRSSIDNGHYIPRAVLSLRYDETNCHAQCKSCNGRHNIDREPYRRYVIGKYGEERLEWLSDKSRELTKGSKLFFIEVIKKYKKDLH